MADNSNVVKHSVITTFADVQKFSGEPDTIDLNQYIKRIETLIKNKGIAEENLKIECFKELYCLEHFRDIILGYKIRVWTDHTAIQNLFKHENLRGRLARWFVTLQNYEVNFEYIPGKKNTAADALSRKYFHKK